MTNTVYTEILKPHPCLQPWIESYFILKPEEIPVSDHPWTIMPDGSGYLIFHLFKHSSRLSLVGPRSVYTNVNRKDRELTLIAQFKPGAMGCVLSHPVSEISDQSVILEYAWPDVKYLEDKLTIYARAKKYKLCISILEQELIKKICALSEVNLLITQAVHLIDRQHGAYRIKSISDKLGVTDRHLREVFKKNVGLSPKRYGKIVRVNNVVKRIDNGLGGSWAKLALDAGYYDQSHLIEDFNQLLGESPEAFMSRANREEVM